MSDYAVSQRVEVWGNRKHGRQFVGTVTRYEPDDGYMGNPEAWITVKADDGTEYAFRRSLRGGAWQPKARSLSQVGAIRIGVVKP